MKKLLKVLILFFGAYIIYKLFLSQEGTTSADSSNSGDKKEKEISVLECHRLAIIVDQDKWRWGYPTTELEAWGKVASLSRANWEIFKREFTKVSKKGRTFASMYNGMKPYWIERSPISVYKSALDERAKW